MTTAFQPNAFQNDAFQIDLEAVLVPSLPEAYAIDLDAILLDTETPEAILMDTSVATLIEGHVSTPITKPAETVKDDSSPASSQSKPLPPGTARSNQ